MRDASRRGSTLVDFIVRMTASVRIPYDMGLPTSVENRATGTIASRYAGDTWTIPKNTQRHSWATTARRGPAAEVHLLLRYAPVQSRMADGKTTSHPAIGCSSSGIR